MSDKLWRGLDLNEPARPGDFRVWESPGEMKWFRQIEIPTCQYPPPRYDDPAKCGKPNRWILELTEGLEDSSYWAVRAREWTPGRAWLEQPPAPCKPKSEAEQAWEAVAAQMPMLNAKEIFMAGRCSVLEKLSKL